MLWSMAGISVLLHDAGCTKGQEVKADSRAASAASWNEEATGSAEENVKMQAREGWAGARRAMSWDANDLCPRARQPTSCETECAMGEAAGAGAWLSRAKTGPLRRKASTLRWAGASAINTTFEMDCDWIQSSRLSMKAAAQPSNKGARCCTMNTPSDSACSSKAAVTRPGLLRSRAAEDTNGCTWGDLLTDTRFEGKLLSMMSTARVGQDIPEQQGAGSRSTAPEAQLDENNGSIRATGQQGEVQFCLLWSRGASGRQAAASRGGCGNRRGARGCSCTRRLRRHEMHLR